MQIERVAEPQVVFFVKIQINKEGLHSQKRLRKNVLRTESFGTKSLSLLLKKSPFQSTIKQSYVLYYAICYNEMVGEGEYILPDVNII